MTCAWTSPRQIPSRVLAQYRWPSSLGLLTLLTLWGCSQPASPGPAWPEQPSPSYPSPNDADQTQGEKAQPQEKTLPLKEDAGQSQHAASTPLAKEYKGAKTLQTLRGKATYYADSLAGNRTANGDIYDPNKRTAAHKKLPFGTVVRVTRQDNQAVTYVRINDRGPFGSADRIIDLSKIAAKDLGMLRAGVVSVVVEVLEKPKS